VQLVEAFAPSDQRGWVLIDGSVLGVGMLLERVAASARLAAGSAADPDDEEIDAWLGDL
jgi:hypothetical protein